MLEHEDPGCSGDSLERIEKSMAIRDARIYEILADESLAPSQREQLIREIEARLDRGEFPEDDDLGSDPPGVGVRKPRPKPNGRRGAKVRPN